MEEYAEEFPTRTVPRDSATPPAPLIEAMPDAEVAVNGGHPGDRLATLTYEVPTNLRGRIGRGQLIWVPLRQKLVLGVIVTTHDEEPAFAARPIHAPVVPVVPLGRPPLSKDGWVAGRDWGT
jgi:hypothetical protein